MKTAQDYQEEFEKETGYTNPMQHGYAQRRADWLLERLLKTDNERELDLLQIKALITILEELKTSQADLLKCLNQLHIFHLMPFHKLGKSQTKEKFLEAMEEAEHLITNTHENTSYIQKV